jgi:hypothetical protein
VTGQASALACPPKLQRRRSHYATPPRLSFGANNKTALLAVLLYQIPLKNQKNEGQFFFFSDLVTIRFTIVKDKRKFITRLIGFMNKSALHLLGPNIQKEPKGQPYGPASITANEQGGPP